MGFRSLFRGFVLYLMDRGWFFLDKGYTYLPLSFQVYFGLITYVEKRRKPSTFSCEMPSKKSKKGTFSSEMHNFHSSIYKYPPVFSAVPQPLFS